MSLVQQIVEGFAQNPYGPQVLCNAAMCHSHKEGACAASSINLRNTEFTEGDEQVCESFKFGRGLILSQHEMIEVAAREWYQAAEKLIRLTATYHLRANCEEKEAQVDHDDFTKLPGTCEFVYREYTRDYPAELAKTVGGVRFFTLLKPWHIQDYLPWDLVGRGK